MTLDRSRPPEASAATELPIPERTRHGLATGMELTCVRRGALPEAMLALVLPAGSASVSSGRAGLPSLVAKVLPEGSGGRSSREMAEWLDRLGIQLSVSTGYDSMVIRVHSLSETLEPALDALAAVALEPDFLEAEVERCRDERVDEIRRARDEPAEVASDVLAELLYGDHPYGRLSRGREGPVSRLDRSALVGFHGERFDPRTAALVACGRLPADFERWVEERFGSWTGGGKVPEALPDPEGTASPEIVLVDRPGSGQSEIRIGAVGIRRGDPAEPAGRVAISILGGLFNSRLNLNLREQKGWTYGARAGLSLRRSPGPVIMRAAVETGVTAGAVGEMIREAARMSEERPSAEEMEMAAGALTRSLPLRFETGGQIVSRLTEEIVFGLSPDHWQRFPERIEAVSREDVRRISSRLFDPEGLAVLVVGDAEAVRSGLDGIGPVRMGRVP